MSIKTDEIINTFYKYLREEMYISYHELKHSFNNFITAYTEEITNSNNLIPSFYTIIESLLSLGYIEFGYQNTELIFFIPKQRILKDKDKYYKLSTQLPYYSTTSEVKNYQLLQPLKMLKSLQSIKYICNDFQNITQFNFLYRYNPKNKKLESFFHKTGKLEVGIYKIQKFDYAYLILEDNTCKSVPRKSENYDALNFAFCYVDIHNKKKLFTYHKEKQILVGSTTFLPTLIKRALFMCNIINFIQHPYYVYQKTEFTNITLEIVKELQRIFSSESVEVIND